MNGVWEQMEGQHGLVLRRQAVGAGMKPESIDARVRQGEWVVVRRGVYTSAARWESLDDWQGRPRLRVLAGSLNMLHPHVVSHESSALLQGLPFLRPAHELVHVTRFGALGGRVRRGMNHHRAPFAPWQVTFPDGVPALDLARTACDVAREHGIHDRLRHAVPIMDAALHTGVTRPELVAAYELMTSWPHVTAVREAVELADAGAESVLESLTRLLLLEVGLGPVQTQFGLSRSGRTVFCDLRVGRRIFECDGLVKFRPVASGGVATRDPAEVLFEEKRREDFIRSFGLDVTRVVWEDVLPRNAEATRRRFAHDILVSDQRYGRDLGDVSPYVRLRSAAA